MTVTSGFAALACYARPRGACVVAKCEICATPLAEPHAHLVEARTGVLCCACAACALLFRGQTARFRRIPERPRRDPSFVLTRGELESLGVPVGLAFFCSHRGRWVARLPSPGGILEAELDERAWSRLLERSRLLWSIEPDVEAFLVHAPRSGPVCSLIAPIDACYALAASVRRLYRGFSGGDAVHREIEVRVRELAEEAEIVSPLRLEGGQ